MRHAKAWLAGGAALLMLLAACAADTTSPLNDTSSTGGGGSKETPNPNGSSSGGGGSDTNAAAPAKQGYPASDGVMLVHSASFPAFRLCFENLPDMLPQPDAAVMPEANVVGVEIGSLVRIDKLKAPGRVYVISEKRLRTNIAAKGKSCGDLITGQILEGTNDYLVTAALTTDIGVERAEVLAITGCGTQGFLDNIDHADIGKGSSKSCGDGWNSGSGNLVASVVPLQASYDTPNDAQIPVQLYNVSEATHALNGTLKVSFGQKANPQTPLDVGTLFGRGEITKLAVDQKEPATYGSNVFAVKAEIPAGSAGPAETVTVSPSLADVQQLSSPTQDPTSYYKTASNYALLVLGDPLHKETLSPGVPNPAYNPRRALHILAVPVLDPSKVDAGAPPTTTEADAAPAK